MTEVILAFLADPGTAEAVLAGAACLAGIDGPTRINGLVVRRPPIETIIPSEEILTREREARVRSLERKRAHALKTAFDRWTDSLRPHDIVCDWCDVEDNAAMAIKEYGSRSDAIVMIGRAASEPERQALHAALFEAERPVLVIPPAVPCLPFGKRVAIAWRNDPRTLKAMLAALRLLGRAEHFDVIEGVREGAHAPHLPEIFEEHGIPAELHTLALPGPAAFGAALLSRAHALGADMLVMGAYAHNPLHNLILGGVTRYMLAHADLPVLMRH